MGPTMKAALDQPPILQSERKTQDRSDKAASTPHILLKAFIDDSNFCVKLKLGPELLLFQLFDGKILSIKTINYG